MKRNFTFKAVLFIATFFIGISRIQSQCTFSGLGANYCANSPNVTLTPSTPGGFFTGSGMVGSVFTPSLATPGTVSVTYAFCSTNYSVNAGTFAPLPVAGSTTLGLGNFFDTGGAVNNDDGTTVALPIGFSFQFFCNTYTQFYIGTNGFITFTGGQATPWIALPFPASATAPLNAICLPWTDLNLNFGGVITYTTLGTAPNRKLMVSFNDVQHHNSNTGGYPVTSQIILYESTNIIEIHTTAMPIPNNAYNATEGIQNATGNNAFTAPGRNGTGNWVGANDMYQFVPASTCSQTQTTIVSPASVSVAGSASICTGQTASLTATGNTTYTWTTPSGVFNTSTLNVAPTANTAYTIAGTNSYGCVASTVKTVTVNTAPVVTATSSAANSSVCSGNTLALTGSGVTSYTWTNSGVTNGVPFTPVATAVYSVVGGNACGTASTTIGVTVNPLPVTANTTSTLICSGSPATLTAGGATTYTWMPGSSTLTNYIVNPTTATNYTVTGQSGACVYTAAVSVSTKTLPALAITALTTAICYGESVSMTASGAISYSWSVPGQISPNIVVTPTNTTVYTLTGTNVVNCTKSITQLVQVSQLPVLGINASNPEVCAGGTSTLSVSGANDYTWENTTPGITYLVNPQTTTVYNVTGTNSATGCHSGTMVTVSVFAPELSVSSNTSICPGTNALLNASGAITYTWTNYNNASTQGILVTPTVSSTYIVAGTVLNTQTGVSCNAVDTIKVTLFTPPAITATSSQSIICRSKTATLTADGAGATGTYTWSASLGNNPVVTVSPTLDQTYNVTGIDANGCKGTASVQVAVSPCAGINALSANSINVSIYPNPSNGAFTVSSEQDITLHIINELGQVINMITLTAGTPQINENRLATGVYFIIGANANGSVKQKLVITE